MGDADQQGVGEVAATVDDEEVGMKIDRKTQLGLRLALWVASILCLDAFWGDSKKPLKDELQEIRKALKVRLEDE